MEEVDGVVIGAGNPKDLVAMCEAADASELFDAVFTGDNLISKPRLDAIVFLSLVAGRTRRVTLGTACMASFVFRHPIVLANRDRINILALDTRLPTMHGFREYAAAGGLVSYGPNVPDLFRRSADFWHDIFVVVFFPPELMWRNKVRELPQV